MRLPAEHLRRFWTMLAHLHGQLWNGSQLARNLGISPPTARHYLDILSDKFGLAPRITRGYHEALRDLDIAVGKVVYSGNDDYAMTNDAHATSLAQAISESGS